MTKKRSPIILEKLKRDSAGKLESMLAELTEVPGKPGNKPSRRRRFIASGKAHMA
ncbi:MAG TPA: hypothetical protein VKV03_14775 [Candidatus Binataceae bacterium]|nr:hypothetical protein [Candidatus Binataceae bacterium]